MIRIIHLSDFHLNKKFLKDWNNYIKQALIDKLQHLSQQKPINFIAFTGDLIDIGGDDFGGAEPGFDVFKKNVQDELAKALCLEKNEFLIVPGNHDIVRDKDLKRVELGNVQYFAEDYQNISEFMSNATEKNDFSGMERIRQYKEFEMNIYKDIPDSEITIFGNAFRLNYQSQKIGVACLNSSWRCYSKNDSGKLIVGEEQLIKANKFISNCDIKIALLHHPLDWLLVSERQIITNHLTKDFDILLLGHVHESKTSMTSGFTGTLFTNIAPSGLNDIRSDSRQYSNGFTVIDFDKAANEIACQYWRYNHNSKDFVLNTDLATEGKYFSKIPNEKSKKKQNLETTLLSHIREDHFKKMDDHLIGTKAAKTNFSIKEAFVLPPINQGLSSDTPEEVEVDLNIAEIIKSKSNFIFFGDQESGKTTLLYRLIREFVDEYILIRKIPVYIDFDDLGNKGILTM
jgi:predicted MPP superfamily phosphohydrolase